MNEEQKIVLETLEVPIEWHVPDSLVSQYATNIVIQHSEHEFVLSFFETAPPLLIGDSGVEELRKIKSLRANCIARIIVAKGRMPAFLQAMQENLRKSQPNASNPEGV